jgi:hypothetical protein
MAHPRTGSTPVPREERALDPRAIARASLHASRNASLWWTSAGVGLATVVALVVGTQAGAWALAALAARAKPLDVAVLALLAVALTALGAILPTA